MSLAENKQIARDFIDEILNKGNVENVNRFVTPDFIYHSIAEDLNGVGKFKKCVASDHITFDEIRYTFVDSIAEYGKVAIVWIVEAKHEKEFRGIAATHKKFETVVVIIFHFEGNKIKEAWAVADGLTAALQLGVVKTESNESR
jgi:predicted ester cyclase